jgi:phenylacetate-coenzyme A ligase PaaK-like adenylate-forming protein
MDGQVAGTFMIQRFLIFLPRFRNAAVALDRLAEAEEWGRTRIEIHQLEALNNLWKAAVRYVPYYRSLRRRHSLPDYFASLSEFSKTVPLLGKKNIREQREEIFSETSHPGKWHYTGGSTGAPTPVYWEHEAHQKSLYCQYRFRQKLGVSFFDKTAFLWGHGASFAPGIEGWLARAKRPIEDFLRNRIRLSAYHLDEDSLLKYSKKLSLFQPQLLYAYASAACRFAEFYRKNLLPPPGLKAVICSAEPASLEMLSTISEGFHTVARREYGSVDAGFIAHDESDGIYRVREDRVYLETIPSGNGHYQIAVTVLGNTSFPLIRYALGDLAESPLKIPPVGFAALESILGRTNDLIHGDNGHATHPELISHVVKYYTREVSRFTARQFADGSVILMLEASELPESGRREIEDKLRKALSVARVSVECHPALPATAAGKHRWIISDLEH